MSISNIIELIKKQKSRYLKRCSLYFKIDVVLGFQKIFTKVVVIGFQSKQMFFTLAGWDLLWQLLASPLPNLFTPAAKGIRRQDV